jgi:hypothetical protein
MLEGEGGLETAGDQKGRKARRESQEQWMNVLCAAVLAPLLLVLALCVA